MRKDFPSLDAHKQCLADSVGMLAGFKDALGQEVEMLNGVLLMIGKQVDFDHITKHEGPHD
jgi:hypothetical protein